MSVLSQRRNGVLSQRSENDVGSRPEVSKNRHQQRQRFRQHEIMSTRRVVLVIMLLSLSCLWITWSNSTENHRGVYVASDSVPPCTFAQLEAAFSLSTNKRRNVNSTTFTQEQSDPSSCWSLEEEILRVPIGAIVNRQYLEPLGQGHKGSVHKAIIRLSSASFTSKLEQQLTNNKKHNNLRINGISGNKISNTSFCVAAVKSDHCHSSLLHIIQSLLGTGTTGVSCLQPGSFLWNDASYMGGEYTGALPFYANNKRDVPGLLSTWGIIEDASGQISRLPRGSLQGAPHPDPTIKGVILPLLSHMTSLSRYRDNHPANRVSGEPAQLFLGAAQGLQFLHRLGLVVQDIVPDNAGLILSNAGGDSEAMSSFLYDNSYLTFAIDDKSSKGGRRTATTTRRQSHESSGLTTIRDNFCKEAAFRAAHGYTNHQYSRGHSRENDVWAISEMIPRYAKGQRFSKNQKPPLSIKDADKLVDFLQSLSSNNEKK